MIDEVFADVKDRMTKAVEAARESFATVRTGRANPSLLQGVQVDYYGTPTPLPQLASVANQDARSLLITPYDKGAMKDIEQAIRDMPNLGANPSNDGSVIRVTLPELTEERRKEFVTIVKSRAAGASQAATARKRGCASGGARVTSSRSNASSVAGAPATITSTSPRRLRT